MQWRSASPESYALLKEYARQNRKNMTEAEKVFWTFVKDNALGHKFLRQHIIGFYIVDFICRDKNLIVEIDGGYHSETSQIVNVPCLGRVVDPNMEVEKMSVNHVEEDRYRQEWLEKAGYKIIRFTNEQVLLDPENTIKTLKQYVSE